MSSAEPPLLSAEEIARDATWLAQALDPASGAARLIRMDAAAYRSASFLDDRMLEPPVEARLAPWPLLESAAALVKRRDARWIFHIGHVGSTLLARLLGELPEVLAVREPRLLRDLANIGTAHRATFADVAQALMSRTFSREQKALVKATSFVSEIAPELVPEGGATLFMYATPQAYIASILAGENSLKELQMLAASREARIAGRVRQLDQARESPAHLAAAAWACEMSSLESAAEQMQDRQVAWLDFDRALKAMPHELARAAAFLGCDAQPALVDAIATGPLIRRYSKALEYDYSASLRRDLIADATARNRVDIADALAMLHSASETSPLLARALARAGSES